MIPLTKVFNGLINGTFYERYALVMLFQTTCWRCSVFAFITRIFNNLMCTSLHSLWFWLQKIFLEIYEIFWKKKSYSTTLKKILFTYNLFFFFKFNECRKFSCSWFVNNEFWQKTSIFYVKRYLIFLPKITKEHEQIILKCRLT